MNLYNPFNGKALFKQPVGLTTYPETKKNFFTFGNKTIYFDLSNEVDYLTAYLNCAPVKSIINKRAQMFVNGKIEILNRNTGKLKRGQKAKQLRELLKKPNALQNWKQFFAQMHTFIDLFGYCPTLKVEPAGMEGQGEITSIWCLPPWLFDVEFTGKWMNQTEKKGIYKAFYLNWDGNRKELDFNSVNLILDNSIGTDNDSNLHLPDGRLKGYEYPVSNWCAQMKSRNTLITKKGAIGILSNVGKDTSGPINLGATDKKEVQDDFARYGLTGEEWQVIVTNASLQWQAMSFPTKDLLLFEEEDSNKQSLCDGLGLYYDILAKTKASTFANYSEAKKAQYQDHIIPDAQSRMEQFSEAIFSAEDKSYLNITYDHIEVLQKGEKEKADALVATNTAYKELYTSGLCTLNDWAAATDQEELANGNEYVSDNTPLAAKLQTGGLTAMQSLLLSQMPAEQKKSVLEFVYGIESEQAKLLAGKDPEPAPTPAPGAFPPAKRSTRKKFNEEDHSRDPGGENGGQFVAKGYVDDGSDYLDAYPNIEYEIDDDGETPYDEEDIKKAMLLTGIPKDFTGTAKVSISERGYHVILKGDGIKMERSIFSKFGNIDNQFFEIKPGSKYAGKGAEIFYSQVKAARAQGYKLIDVYAGGEGPGFKMDDGGKGKMNGYYTWARLGYEPTNLRSKEKFQNIIDNYNESFGTDYKSHRELMSTKSGQDMWRQHGGEWAGRFELAENSYSSKTLKQYINGKRRKNK